MAGQGPNVRSVSLDTIGSDVGKAEIIGHDEHKIGLAGSRASGDKGGGDGEKLAAGDFYPVRITCCWVSELSQRCCFPFKTNLLPVRRQFGRLTSPGAMI